MSDPRSKNAGDVLVDNLLKGIQSYSLFGSGRLTRHQYMRNFAIAKCVSLSVIPMAVILGFVLGVVLYFNGYTPDQTHRIVINVYLVFAIAIILLSVVIDLFAAAQRFHDMGQSGSRAGFLFIPLYNFYIIYKLISTNSQETMNKYGPLPTDVINKKRIEIFFACSILVLIGINLL